MAPRRAAHRVAVDDDGAMPSDVDVFSIEDLLVPRTDDPWGDLLTGSGRHR